MAPPSKRSRITKLSDTNSHSYLSTPNSIYTRLTASPSRKKNRDETPGKDTPCHPCENRDNNQLQEPQIPRVLCSAFCLSPLCLLPCFLGMVQSKEPRTFCRLAGAELLNIESCTPNTECRRNAAMATRGTLRHSSFLVRYSIFMREKRARPTLHVATLMRLFLNQACFFLFPLSFLCR